MMSLPSGILSLSLDEAGEAPIECCNSGLQSPSFHDLHGDQPEARASYSSSSSSSSEMSEPSIGTKRAGEELGVKLLTESRRATSAATDQQNGIRRSPREMQLQSQQKDVHNNQVYLPNTCRNLSQCDRVVSGISREISYEIGGYDHVNINGRKYSRREAKRGTGGRKVVQIKEIGGYDHVNINGRKYSRREAKRGTGGRKIVQIKVPKRILNENDIRKIALYLENDWKCLGLELGFIRRELDAFERDNRMAGLHEIIHQMLLTWKKKQGTEAYIRCIASKLVDIKRPDVAKLFST